MEGSLDDSVSSLFDIGSVNLPRHHRRGGVLEEDDDPVLDWLYDGHDGVVHSQVFAEVAIYSPSLDVVWLLSTCDY